MKSEVDIVVDKRKLSLIRNILLRIFLLSIGIVFIIAIITYLKVYSNETEKKLEQLKKRQIKSYMPLRIKVEIV